MSNRFTKLILLSLLASLFLPVSSANQNHTVTYSTLNSDQQAMSDYFDVGTSPTGTSCSGATFALYQAVQVVSGTNYFLTYGQFAGTTITVTVIGSVSGTLWTDTIAGTGTSLSNIKAGTNAAITTYGSGSLPRYDVVFFKAIAAETITLTCTGTGTPSLLKIWNPNIFTNVANDPPGTVAAIASSVNNDCVNQCNGALVNADTIFYKVHVNIRECAQDALSNGNCASDLGPVAGATVNLTTRGPNLVPTLTVISSSSGFSNYSNINFFSPPIPFGEQFFIQATKAGYVTSTAILLSFGPEANATLYLVRGKETLIIQNVTISPREATFITPAAANFTIFVNQTGTFYWTIFQLNPLSFVPVAATSTFQIKTPIDTVTYPYTGYTTSTGIASNLGSYYIVASNSAGGIEDITPFRICANSNCVGISLGPINSVINATISDYLQSNAATPITQTPTISSAQQATDFVLLATDFAYGKFLGIPGMYWFLITGYILVFITTISRARGGV